MPNTIKTIRRIFGGHYVVVTEADVTYVVYQRDGLWWAKHQGTLQIVDSAPTKAQLLRSIENVE